MELLVPVGTPVIVPRKMESDWARAKSTMRLPVLRVDVVPVDEVNTTELMASLRLIIPMFAGRVSETSTRLTLAVLPPPPPPPAPLGRPLQEVKDKTAAKAARIEALLRFIGHPTTD